MVGGSASRWTPQLGFTDCWLDYIGLAWRSMPKARVTGPSALSTTGIQACESNPLTMGHPQRNLHCFPCYPSGAGCCQTPQYNLIKSHFLIAEYTLRSFRCPCQNFLCPAYSCIYSDNPTTFLQHDLDNPYYDLSDPADFNEFPDDVDTWSYLPNLSVWAQHCHDKWEWKRESVHVFWGDYLDTLGDSSSGWKDNLGWDGGGMYNSWYMLKENKESIKNLWEWQKVCEHRALVAMISSFCWAQLGQSTDTTVVAIGAPFHLPIVPPSAFLNTHDGVYLSTWSLIQQNTTFRQ